MIHSLSKANTKLDALSGESADLIRLLYSVFEVVPVGVSAQIGLEDPLVVMNEMCAKLFGASEAIGAMKPSERHDKFSFTAYRDGRPFEETETPMQRAIRTRSAVRGVEFELHQPNGKIIHVIESALPIFDDQGEVTGAVATFMDVSNLKAARSDQAILSAIVESSHDGILSTTMDGIVVTWNYGAEMIYGYSADEAIGKHISFLVPDGAAVRPEPLLEILAQGGTVCNLEAIRKRKSGETFPISLTLSPVKNELGDIVGVSSISRDISDVRQYQNNLIESENRFRFVSNNAPVMIWQSDQNRSCEFFNEPFLRFVGVSLDQALQSGYDSFVHPDDLPNFNAEYALHFERMEPFELECRLRRNDGNYRWIVSNGSPNFDAGGGFIGYVGTCLDITERKEAEKILRQTHQDLETRVAQRTIELKAANEELESICYSVSHDLRAPLRAINGFVQIVRQEAVDVLDDEANHLLSRVCANAAKMDQLINDILAFSRLGKQPLNCRNVEMGSIARDAWDSTTTPSDRNKVVFIVEPMATAYGDPMLIHRVFTNLLSNAIKFCIDSAEPTVRVYDQMVNGKHCYCVEDNGIGFDPEYSERIFGVFQRLHRDEEYEGTGVGLAIVDRIVRKLGGTVWAESKLGEGTRILFTLPAATNEKSEAPATMFQRV